MSQLPAYNFNHFNDVVLNLYEISELDKFLQEDEYCNFNNPLIKNLAAKITEGCVTQQEKAVALFYWVRDNILYRVSLWQRTASQTLEEGEGTCTNKSNLLVALLRSQGIPAGYGVMKVHGQKYLGPISIPLLNRHIKKETVHFYAVVYLKNNWIKVDPSDDYKFSVNTSYFNPTSELINWDGKGNAELNIDKSHIINDKFPIDNISCYMGKTRRLPFVIRDSANIYIRFLRKNKIKVTNSLELQAFFLKYLIKNKPFYFFIFISYNFLFDIYFRLRPNWFMKKLN